jgi:hypothetical protein
MGRYVIHIRFLEYREMTRVYTAIHKGRIEAIDAGLSVTGAGGQET